VAGTARAAASAAQATRAGRGRSSFIFLNLGV
jgi:hypothetical protein